LLFFPPHFVAGTRAGCQAVSKRSGAGKNPPPIRFQEKTARQQIIDAQLATSGWAVQTKTKINLSTSRGVAVCEPFSAEQLSWLYLIRDPIATAIGIEQEDLELATFNQRGGLGKTHQLIGEQLPKLLDESNTVLAVKLV
jgi:hypothetical protein